MLTPNISMIEHIDESVCSNGENILNQCCTKERKRVVHDLAKTSD
jgi:hypothetical protein